MDAAWEETRLAFTEAAQWFVATAGLVADRWDAPGLGDWDVRSLAGHTGRALHTVELYLSRPAAAVDIATPADYIRLGSQAVPSADVAARGRDAGHSLGPDPAAALAEMAARVRGLVAGANPDAVVMTAVGGMRLRDYLPTRTFELVVHTCDLAVAIGAPLTVPDAAAREALQLVQELAIGTGSAGLLLLTATGRTVLPGRLPGL